jgi:hypothetical protein
MPGEGVMRKPQSKRKIKSLSALGIAAIVLCGGSAVFLAVAYFLFLNDPATDNRSTNNAQLATADLAAIIADTAQAASTQTALASVPDAFSAELMTITETMAITPSETLASTIPAGTDLPSLTPPLVISVACSCSGDSLNCRDFPNRQDAQICFNHCVYQGFGHVYLLDGDGNGIACESR